MPAAPTSPTLPPQVALPTFTATPDLPHLVPADVWALPVMAGDADTGPLLGPGAEAAGEHLGLDLLGLLEAARGTGEVGEVTSLPVVHDDVRQVALVGVGAGSSDDLRRAGAALAQVVRDRDRVATSLTTLADPAGLEGFVAGLVLGSFHFHWRSTDPEGRPVASVHLCGVDRPVADLDRAVAMATAAWRSRHLATVPSNLKTPAWLADQAVEIARESGLEVRVWDEQQLAAEGFGGILGVGQASASPPRLIRLDYVPPGLRRRARASLPTVALVGKGITFDSGGLSIKPPEGMLTMKRDMTGAAIVLSVMGALAAVGCPVRVVGLVPAAENAISGSAVRPGDVLRHYGGRTSEVTNTDAEGRLVMADAMAYAVAEVEPDVLVDVATLTGAMKVALGLRTGGFMADHDSLVESITTASAHTGEPLWRMPLVESYGERLASKIADADHCPTSGPGAIMAALFLRHFTGGVPWLHLDLAPVGDTLTAHHEYTPGPSGFGARTLLAWLGGDDPLAGIDVG